MKNTNVSATQFIILILIALEGYHFFWTKDWTLIIFLSIVYLIVTVIKIISNVKKGIS